MKIGYLSPPQPNTSLIGERCDSLTNHWAIGGLRVNSSSVKGGLKSFPLFLLEDNAILLLTVKAGCDRGGGARTGGTPCV